MIKNLKRFILTMGLVVLFTHTANAKWVQTNGLYNEQQINALAVSGGTIFAGTDSGLFRSTDSGTSWTAVDSGLGKKPVRSFAMSGGNLFAGTSGYGIFLSTNNGASWTAIVVGPIVLSLAVSGGNLFAGTYSGVFLATNNGAGWTWTAINSGLPASATIYSLAVSGGNIFAGAEGGVFLSSNNGTSWTAVNSGLTYPSVTSLAVSGSSIFAGTFGGGVFLSTNNGTSWTAVNSGLPANTYVWSLAVSDSTIFAGTSGSGVWYRPLSEMIGVTNDKSQQKMSKQYTGGFKINISKNGITVLLPENLNNGAITVGLFTVSGKRIYSAAHQAYNGILNIPLSGLSTGTYLMSITGKNTTLFSSFVVTK
jgi:photosystem II stability/assembly factor-like uncharacterized protein